MIKVRVNKNSAFTQNCTIPDRFLPLICEEIKGVLEPKKGLEVLISESRRPIILGGVIVDKGGIPGHLDSSQIVGIIERFEQSSFKEGKTICARLATISVIDFSYRVPDGVDLEIGDHVVVELLSGLLLVITVLEKEPLNRESIMHSNVIGRAKLFGDSYE